MRHALATLFAFALLAGCSGREDDAALPYQRGTTNEVRQWTADMQPLLAEPNRAQRWREQHARWAVEKAKFEQGRRAEREQAIVRTLAEDRDFLATVLELRRKGALGAAGALPAALEAEHHHASVNLRNVTRKALRVDAWRVVVNARGLPLSHWELQTSKPGGRIFEPEIEAGGTRHFFETPGWPYDYSNGDLPLELEVRNGEKLVWITDTRLHVRLDVPPDAVEEVLKRAAETRRR